MPFFIALNFIFFYHTKVGQGMKKLFVIYLCVLCLAPVLAHSATCNTQACVDCVKVGGKSWDPLGNNGNGQCVGCPDDSYHPTCTGTTDCYEECTTVDAGNYKNNEGSGVLPCPNQIDGGIIETNEAQTYIGNCGCSNQSRTLIHSYNGNKHFYYCGVCGLGLQPSLMQNVSGSLSQCSCEDAHANHVYGTDVSNNGTHNECACAKNANDESILISGLCMCGTSTTNSQEPYSSINNGITTYACCPGLSTYDSNKRDCVCNVQFAKITRDASNKLTECACNDSNMHSGNSCVCQANRYVTFGNNSNQQVNWGETPQYLKSCTKCPNNSSTDTSDNYPRFCKCNTGYYQDEPSSATSNPDPACHQCPTQTTTPSPGSIGETSCRLRNDTNFSISNTHTNSMRLIPEGATILPIYTNPYTTNNNNTQSQYTH